MAATGGCAAEGKKRGRAKGSPNWTAQEMTALGGAALEASDTPDSIRLSLLESRIAAKYGEHLRIVCEEEGGWVVPARSNYSIEDSIELRPAHGGLWGRFNGAQFKAHIVNKVGPAYDKAAPGGCPPSGKQREDVIYWTKVYLWESLNGGKKVQQPMNVVCLEPAPVEAPIEVEASPTPLEEVRGELL